MGAQFLHMSVDLVGFISGKLRDLRGIRTLANELIQNADDAEGATEITFDFRADALYVTNDGLFREKDFDRLRTIASGGKRDEEGTTGAFGIGFISVYQVTDHPELTSSGRYWTIRPERADNERIEQQLRSQTPGTHFRLPWAFDAETPLRKQLRAQPVDLTEMDSWVQELAEALPGASLFLKHLNTLSLCREGQPVVVVQRLEEEGQTLLEVNGQTQIWHILTGDFAEEESQLRQQYPQIEPKRKSIVRIALPADGNGRGLLCACLPTQMESGLPLHINADFFPSVDRKRIQMDGDYQGEWNRAALGSAARLLAAKLPYLRDHVLGHTQLWAMVEAAHRLAREARAEHYDRVFAEFWEQLKSALGSGDFIYTGQGTWLPPSAVRYLRSEEEEEVRPLLEQMSIVLVHPDLRPFQNLLIGDPISVKMLDVKDIADALRSAGCTSPMHLASTPSWLREPGNLPLLWREVFRLLPQRRGSGGEQELASCAIAPANGGLLYPPGLLWRADPETVELFGPLLGHPFLAETGPEGTVLFERLCHELSLDRAIARLSALGHATLKERVGDDPTPLLLWFAKRRHLLSPQDRSELAHLPVFPAASGGLRRLTELALPGGFADPLQLTDLVDHKRVTGLEDFMLDLGVIQLTFERYVQGHVLPLLERPDQLTDERRRQLVTLLAQRLWEITANDHIRLSLARASLIECTEGLFRPASEVYLPTLLIREILGTKRPFTHQMDSEHAVSHLYQWLGVRTAPRQDDVLWRLNELTEQPPGDEERRIVELIFRYLSKLIHQEAWSPTNWAFLKSMAWLPARDTRQCWYKPFHIYSVFSEYLFASQALFLDLPYSVQQEGNDLLHYLGVGNRPTPAQVVKHLLTCAAAKQTVNQEVYVFLTESAEDPAVDLLKGRPCLLLRSGTYVRPDEVYWGEHPFGRRRSRLGPELRTYTTLFARIGVQEHPDHTDAITVLLEIASEYGSTNQVVEDETEAVILGCWQFLSERLADGSCSVEDLTPLREAKVILNGQGVLRRTTDLFFDDQGGLGKRFRQLLQNDLIIRPLGAWQAMQAAGVRSLRAAAMVRLDKAESPRVDSVLNDLLEQRFDQVLRCLKPMRNLQTGRIASLRFIRVQELVLQWSVEVQGRTLATEPEPTPAFYHDDVHELYVCEQKHGLPWSAVAREIALAAGAEEDIGPIASGIKEVLSARSRGEAAEHLSDLGFAEVGLPAVLPSEGPVIDGLGGDAIPAVEDSREALPIHPDDASVPDATEHEGGQTRVAEPLPGGEGPTGVPPGRPRGEGAAPPIPERSDGPPDDGYNPTGPKQPGPALPPGGSVAGGKKAGAPGQRKRSRLISYVIADDPQTPIEPTSEEPEGRSAVDEAGIERVLDFEARQGRESTVMHHNNPGYDVVSYDPTTKSKRYIEVKSISCRWVEGDAAMSPTQFQTAMNLGEAFWLYVVERSVEKDYILFRIQNPARQVTHFVFDHGWQALDELHHQPELDEDYDPFDD